MTRSAQVGPPTLTELKECPGCGLFHVVPSLRPGMSARCSRCPTTLHRVGSHSLDYSIALTVGALVMLIIMCATTLMNVQTAGIMHQAGLFSGPVELVHRGMGGLAAVVVFVTVIAPFGKLIATLYVLIRMQEATPPRHLRRIFRPSGLISVTGYVDHPCRTVDPRFNQAQDPLHPQTPSQQPIGQSYRLCPHPPTFWTLPSSGHQPIVLVCNIADKPFRYPLMHTRKGVSFVLASLSHFVSCRCWLCCMVHRQQLGPLDGCCPTRANGECLPDCQPHPSVGEGFRLHLTSGRGRFPGGETGRSPR
jgi:hypothetical protein